MDWSGTVSPAVWWVIGGLAAVSLTVMALALVDLARHEVRHLPKLGWAAIIVLVSFPLGVIVYFVLGRVEREPAAGDADAADADAADADADAADADAAAGDGDAGVPGQGAGGGERPGAGPGRTIAVAEPAVLAAFPADPANPADRAPSPAATAAAPVWPPSTGTDLVLRTRGLGKTYRETAALTGVDLAVPRLSTYGLIGPNGAGKTTLLSILAGLRWPTTGTVEVAVPRQRVAVLVDTPQFEPWLTAYEVVDLARHLTAPAAPAARVREALAEAGLAGAASRRVGGFSRGMLQRLGLAGCLVGDPELLLLDEPASALDPAGRRDVLDLIGRLAQTKTVLLSTHILADVQQVCDTVAVIDHGRLRYQGPLRDLLARTGAAYLLHIRPPAGELVAALRAEPWLSELTEPAPGRLRLVVSDPVRAEQVMPRLLAAHDAALVSFQPATDLETAFLELTT